MAEIQAKNPTFPDEAFNPCTFLRKRFPLSKAIRRARIYATANGVYQLALNGNRVGNIELAPEFNDYTHFHHYQTYDVTTLLQKGENTIGVVLGDGWYGGFIGISGLNNYQYGSDVALLMQVEITYDDGTTETVVTDDGFKAATGPIVYSELFKGEKFDARKELINWDGNNFDDSEWRTCVIENDVKVDLRAFYGEPVKVIEEIKPLSVTTSPKGETIVDVGQVIAGKFRVRLRGNRGVRVQFACSEVVDANGCFVRNITGTNKDQTDIYILKGDSEEIYEPLFTYHGFRYIKVDGYSAKLDTDDFTALVVSSDLPQTGHFECNDARLNRLQQNIVWSQKANFISIPTDCPQREKMGWTGDIFIYAPTAAFNMETAAFLTRWMRSVAVEQLPDGQVPVIIPYISEYQSLAAAVPGGFNSSAGWGDACYFVPWVLYQTYGDSRILEEYYGTMKKWVAYIEKTARENNPENQGGTMTVEVYERQKYLWNTGFHFGDWLAPGISVNEQGDIDPVAGALLSKGVVAPCFFAFAAEIMGKIAHVLGKENDAIYYGELNRKIREAFAAEYIHSDGTIEGGFQGIYVLALKMNLVPDALKTKVGEKLAALIEENDNRLDTGFMSVPYLLDVLFDHGHKDLAYKLLFQTKCPSWLYQVENGATTIWEAWNAIAPDGTINEYSHNHYAFGCVGDFLYRRIGGIQRLAPGYKRILIQPDFACGLTNASASYKSIHGWIRVAWQIENKKTAVHIAIPANTTARVVLPGIEEDIPSGNHQYHCTVYAGTA